MQTSLAEIPPALLVPLVAGLFLFFGLQGVSHHLRKDRFLERLFTEHREIWEELGGPRGWQWSPPPGVRAPANATIYFDWFARDEPTWLQRAPGLREDYLVVRRNIRRWNFVIMPIFIGWAALIFLLIYLFE